MSIARSGLKLFGGRTGNLVIGFVAVTVFARELGSGLVGSYFLFQALLSVVTLLADGGVRGAVVKRISEGRAPGEVFGTAVALKTALFVPTAVLVLALLGPIERFVGADLGLLLLLTALLREAGRTTDSVLQGEIRIGRAATVELVQKGVYAVVGIGLVVDGFGVYGPVYGLIAGFAAMTVVGLLSVETGVDRPTVETARSLLSYARFNLVNRVGGVGYSWVDVVVIGVFLSNAHVGAYEVAWKVASVVMVFGDALAAAAFPQLSEYAGTGRTDRIESVFPRLASLSLAVVVPAVFGAVALSSDILAIVFGPEYVLASVALVVLMLNNVSSAFHRFVSRTLQALDRPDLVARSVLVTLALNVVCNLALVPRYGLVGAAVATTVASLLGNLLALAYLDELLDVRFLWSVLAWCVLAAAAMSVAVGYVRDALAIETPLELVAVVGIGVATYGCLALAAPPVRSLAADLCAAVVAGEDAGTDGRL